MLTCVVACIRFKIFSVTKEKPFELLMAKDLHIAAYVDHGCHNKSFYIDVRVVDHGC